MNKVILMGRLVRDPDIRCSQGANGSMTIARYTLAVDRKYKKDGEANADFIGCIAFGKLGDFAEMYLHQGMKIAVTGHIQTGSYTNKDGQKVYTTDIVVEEQEFCESKNANNGSSPATSMSQEQPVASDGFMSLPMGVEDEGLPFN